MKFIIKKTVNWQFYFDIEAKNGQILCRGETCPTKRYVMEAIDIIKRESGTATIEDLTEDLT